MNEYTFNSTHLFTSKPAFVKINKKELSSLVDKEDNESIQTI